MLKMNLSPVRTSLGQDLLFGVHSNELRTRLVETHFHALLKSRSDGNPHRPDGTLEKCVFLQIFD